MFRKLWLSFRIRFGLLTPVERRLIKYIGPIKAAAEKSNEELAA